MNKLKQGAIFNALLQKYSTTIVAVGYEFGAEGQN